MRKPRKTGQIDLGTVEEGVTLAMAKERSSYVQQLVEKGINPHDVAMPWRDPKKEATRLKARQRKARHNIRP